MSIFSALSSAVAGLSSQAFALGNISDNIANSQTTAYKRVDSTFEEMIPDTPADRQAGGTVRAMSRGTTQVQGDMVTSSIGTNMALSGEGFFVIKRPVDRANGQPVFADQNLYTRRGDFDIDKDGYVVNGSGGFLTGVSIDPETGISMGRSDVIKITTAMSPAKATTKVTFSGNLPSTPQTSAYDKTKPGSDLYVEPQGGVTSANQADFLAHTIAAGTVTAYDATGNPKSIQLRFAKTKVDAVTGEATWHVYYGNPAADPTIATSNTWISAGGTAPTDIVFDTKGQLKAPAGKTLTLTGLTIERQDVTLDLSGSLTQFADATGGVSVKVLRQDGNAAGSLNNLTVSDDGRLVGTFTNGVIKPLAKISIVQFNAPDQLKRLDGGSFAETAESGLPIEGLNGASVRGSYLEGSNADISSEFSKLIVTQQAYAANTRIVTSAQQMLQDTINLIR